MAKKFFFIFILIFSSLVWAETVQKKKTFESWTITLDAQAKTLRIVDSDGKASFPKSYVYKDESSEKEAADSKPKSINDLNAKKEFVVTSCTKLTLIHGNDMKDLETIYNSLNSAEDCKNLDLHAMGFDAAAACAVHRDPETGKILHYTDLILCKDIDWDE